MDIIFLFINDQGIGDNIRGLISLLQIKEKIKNIKEINIYVDFSNSRISKYILNKLPNKFSEIIKNKPINKFIYYDENLHDDKIINYILKSKEEILLLYTNNFPDIKNINNEIKIFIKNIFEFTPEFNDTLKNYLDILGNDYDVYHYRLGDQVFTNDSGDYNKFINLFQNNIKNDIKNNNKCIILSDSLNLKKKIHQIYDNKKVIVFLEKPTHTRKTTDEKAIHIFIDFFIITKAKNIYCWCVYRWISNFVLWTSYIYDIPLKSLKK